jgi:hypothetical protein
VIGDKMLQSLSEFGYTGFLASDCGEIWSESKSSWLKQCPDQRGYLLVNLNKYGTHRVHRLIAMVFIPNVYNKPQVNHINGIKTDNRAINLEWVTNLENAKHAMNNNLMPHKLFTEKDVRLICNEFEHGTSCAVISQKYGFSYDAIFQIKRGMNWQHIAKEYSFCGPKLQSKRLTEDEVRDICKCLLEKYSITDIAERFQTSKDVIQKIKCGVNGRYISKDYF